MKTVHNNILCNYIITEIYNEHQARDSHGRWTSGQGTSTVKIDGKTYKVVRTPEEGVDAILKGKRVFFDDQKNVHTSLKKLAEMAADAKSKGKEAPNYDLCKVAVKGTNIFCTGNKGIKRIDMPQLGGVPAKGSLSEKFTRNPYNKAEVIGAEAFKTFLKEKGYKIKQGKVPVAKLMSTQNELVGPKVAKMMTQTDFDISANPIFITADNYILDGHHRWAANVGKDAEDGKLGNWNMPVEIIQAPITEVLPMTVKWGQDVGLKAKSG